MRPVGTAWRRRAGRRAGSGRRRVRAGPSRRDGALFDQALSGRESAARARLTEVLAERARGGANRQALLDDILRIVLDQEIGDDQVGARLRGEIGHERMRAAWEARRERLPRDHGHLAMMDASMAYLRQFVPDVLAAVRFAGRPRHGRAAAGRDHPGRAVRDQGPQGPRRRARQVRARPLGRLPREGREGRRRHRLPALLGAVRADGPVRRAALGRRLRPRVAPVRRHCLFPSHLAAVGAGASGVLPRGRQAGFAAGALALANDELHAALSDLEVQLARGGGPGEVRLGADGELVIPPLTAEDVPAEAEALRAEFGALLPRVPIASVLVEVDARTGFTDHVVHAGGKVARPPDLTRNLLYVIIAEATNMGLGAMAESCGVPYDVLAWTAEWYFRAETLEAANAAIVNYHHRLPLARAFGTGTLSSSDGQRFPVKGKSLTARHLSRYFARGQGISTYTHVSDQHSTFDTKVIAATDPEAPTRSTASWATRPTCSSPSTPPTPTARRWRTSHCSTSWAFSCPPASATWARSPCTGRGRGPASRPVTPPPGTCSPAASTRS